MTKTTQSKHAPPSVAHTESGIQVPLDGSNGSFRVLVDHVPGVIYLCRNDPQFSMLYLSETVESILGYTAREFIDGSVCFVDLYHPEDSSRVFEELDKFLQEGEKFHLIYRLKHRNGIWKWIEEFGVGIEREGKIEFLEGYLHDITDRVRSEEALKASETRWRTLVENAPNNVAIIDREANYLYINNVLPEFDREAILSSDVYRWVPPKHHEVIRESIRGVLEGRRPVRYEVEVDIPGQGSTWWSCCMGLIDMHPDHPEIMVISTDITQEKQSKEELAKAHADLEKRVRERTEQLTEMNHRLQEEIVEREKAQQEMIKAKEVAESASQAKGDFIASMSHELRTPLTSILGFVGLLEGERHGELTEPQSEFVTTIRRNAEHLLSLINDILDVAKAEAGQVELSRSVVDLDLLARQCLEMISSRALESGVEIAPSPTQLGTGVVDERMIRQIILNLLANACKFTPEGGQIGIRGYCESDQAVITIWDTGIGIEPDLKDSIFDRFKQLDSGDSRKYPGTGLGLTLAKKFVEMHGGKIWVESSKGTGSRFSFSVPLSDEF